MSDFNQGQDWCFSTHFTVANRSTCQVIFGAGRISYRTGRQLSISEKIIHLVHWNLIWTTICVQFLSLQSSNETFTDLETFKLKATKQYFLHDACIMLHKLVKVWPFEHSPWVVLHCRAFSILQYFVVIWILSLIRA